MDRRAPGDRFPLSTGDGCAARHVCEVALLGFISDLVRGALMVLTVPLAILVVGVPIALGVRVVLWAAGQL